MEPDAVIDEIEVPNIHVQEIMTPVPTEVHDKSLEFPGPLSTFGPAEPPPPIVSFTEPFLPVPITINPPTQLPTHSPTKIELPRLREIEPLKIQNFKLNLPIELPTPPIKDISVEKIIGKTINSIMEDGNSDINDFLKMIKEILIEK